MAIYINIIRQTNEKTYEVENLGGNTQNDIISPKGLYSSPQNEKGLTLNVNGSDSQIILPLQKHIELQPGDVCITNGKSNILLSFADDTIKINSENIDFNSTDMNINSNVNFNGEDMNINSNVTIKNSKKIKHGIQTIGNDHKHFVPSTPGPTDKPTPGGIFVPPSKV